MAFLRYPRQHPFKIRLQKVATRPRVASGDLISTVVLEVCLPAQAKRTTLLEADHEHLIGLEPTLIHQDLSHQANARLCSAILSH
jgi:hypothetical protein